MAEVSTKPYLMRAIVEWCVDSGFTPYVAVAVDASVRVPQECVKNGEIVLNVSSLATHRLQIGNDAIEFQARFGGVARDIHVPIARVIAVYARENGQGMAFDVPRALQPHAPAPDAPGDASRTGERLRAVQAPKSAMSLVPALTLPSTEADNASDAGPDAAPGQSGSPKLPPGGDRPRLTRIK